MDISFTEGVSVILQREKKTILQLRDNIPSVRGAGLWGFFAGGVEEGETPVAAAVREIYEELNIRLEEKDLSYFMTLQLPKIRERHHVYVAPFYYDDSNISLREGQAYKSFSDDEIEGLKNVVPGTKEVIRIWKFYSESKFQ